MPPDAQDTAKTLTGRCYCGAFSLSAKGSPQTVAYCHCRDCRRVSGAPVSAFAAFSSQQVTFSPDAETSVSVVEGVRRWFCPTCGTHLKASYSYLPGQIYVPVGVFDDTEALAPESHSHWASALTWLCLTDTLPQDTGSGRDRLTEATPE